MALEDLYREVILDHYRNPRNRVTLERPTNHADGHNPLCGDEISLGLIIVDGRIEEIGIEGQGCSISQSSASMMSEAIKGRTLDEVATMASRFRAMMTIDEDGESEIDPDRPGQALGDLEALQGVRNYPVRIKCANLPWTTLAEALDA